MKTLLGTKKKLWSHFGGKICAEYVRYNIKHDFLLHIVSKTAFFDSKKRFHALGMRNLDSPHKIIPKGIIFREKNFF
jgi:hypothetical protein